MSLRDILADIDPTCDGGCGETIEVHQVPYLLDVASLRKWARLCKDCRPDHIQRAVDRHFARGVD